MRCRRDFTPWRHENTLRYYYLEKEYSLLECGKLLGCAECTALQWCRKHGIETRDPQEARDAGTPPELEDEAWLQREYLTRERTCAAIADELDVSDLTVSNWLRRHEIPTRPANARRNRVTVECNECGESFRVQASREDRAKYCSRGCYYAGMDMPKGRDHWSWRDTPEHRPSGTEWQNLRENVRERDGYECRVCGVHEDDMVRTLDVHHLDRVRDADDPRAAVEMDESRLVALCRSCHRRVERLAPLLPPALE